MSGVDALRRIGSGCARLTLRGASETSPDFEDVVRQAKASVPSIVLRTNALAYGEPKEAERLADLGVTGVVVPLFSHVQKVHDRLAGRKDALVGTLLGMRALARAGLEVGIEIPLIPLRLSQPTAVVDLALRAVPALASVRLFVPERPVPPAVAPPPWSEVAGALAAVVAHCEERGIALELRAHDGIPFCALADHPEAWSAFRFHPNREVQGRVDTPPPCASCAARKQCRGPTQAYLEANGHRDLRPFDSRPRELYHQRTGQLRVWTESEREAARKSWLLVVRPTVHCNQDCSFCSANETTRNVWVDPDTMKRAIARAAQRGLKRISFSGGEPTLSRDLLDYVTIAHRLGIGDIELVSNAVLLARRERAEALAAAGLTHAFVSLHAHDEMLSRAMTNKVGDFERTVAGLHNLVDLGVETVVNHVIASRNYPFLPRFVEWLHGEFGGRVGLSFAFVTPQFKAFQNLSLVPRISEVSPYLRAAMSRALELGQPFWVGSRQGIPPCFLGEFAPWSDVLALANEAASEDASQKTRAEACGQCLYASVCQGLWRPYVAQYGLDELTPVEGPPLDEATRLSALTALQPFPWGVPASFEQAPAVLRRRHLEGTSLPVETPPIPILRSADLAHHRSLRVLVAGSAYRARLFGAALGRQEGVEVAAVASPHAPDLTLDDSFGRSAAFRDVGAAIEDVDPDAVVVAAATPAHDAIVRLALEAGTPVLCEKPLTNRLETSAELVALARERGVMLAVVHNLAHAAGMDRLAAIAPDRVRIVRRFGPESLDLPRGWSRVALFESLYHPVALAVYLLGRAALSDAVVEASTYEGDSRPGKIGFELRGATGVVEVRWEVGAVDDLSVEAARDTRRARWHRAGPSVTVDEGDGARTPQRNGSEVDCMVADFRDAILSGGEPRATGEDALLVARLTRDVVRALADAGAPFERSTAPKHASSRELHGFDFRE